jgi:hypothetical protein
MPSSFSPLKLRVPDGPLYLFAGCIAASSRIFLSSMTMQCTRAFLESVVLSLEDLPTFSLGWTINDGQNSPSSHPFAMTDPCFGNSLFHGKSVFWW